MADNKTFAITSFESGGFIFVRAGNNIAWYCDHKGKRYGDYIELDGDEMKALDADTREEYILEMFEVLNQQAVETMKLL